MIQQAPTHKVTQSHLVSMTLIILMMFSCSQDGIIDASPQFQLLESKETGLDFDCKLSPDEKFNLFIYMYFFNGGGVAVGDYNNDGWEDLFFTSNMSENKLFLNQGGEGKLMQFKDVTETAGLKGMEGWTTGASAVDINNDGLLDIYVSQLGDFKTIKGKNQFYICQGIENGIPIFEDKAAELGLDFVKFSTQAAFFDYDLDGDLDMYQLNHSVHHNGTFGQRKNFNDTHPTSGDKLFKNENGKFIDVTNEAGVYSTAIGYGLGIVTGDVNLDGYPDIYIGNDFHENDYLYLNQQDGTFKEVITEQTKHTSKFSMGVDMADMNNDGWADIMSLDMMPYDPVILKSSMGENEYKVYNFKLGYGYHHQFARNNLQLNNGDGTFSEIGMFADVHSTDWSWANLFLDFDHDGSKDLFISNGIPRRLNDIDYINFKANDDLRFKANNDHLESDDLLLEEKMPQIKLPNRFFKNTKDLSFENIENQILGNKNSYSNGSVYADLDNDGDLDIVVNNLEDQPFVYKNLTIENNDSSSNYLSFNFQGTPKNINAIGAKVVVFQNDKIISGENFPVRGFQSSVQEGIHLGVGIGENIDSIVVIWPDRTFQKIENFKLNSTTQLAWKSDLPIFDFSSLKKTKPSSVEMKDISEEVKLDYVHDENPFVEFNRESLIPHMVSREGPALAVGDLNGDGLDDLFLGSGKRRRSAVFLQTKNGQFYNNTSTIIKTDSVYEDVDAIFVDIENDGDLDIVVASGGNEFRGESEYLQQRIYINDGKGNFINKIIFPEAYLTASCVLPTDFNNDGLTDFFFGARAEVWKYGLVPTSFLFQNKGNGQFENVTQKYLGDDGKTGLVKNGTWTDIDQDGDEDLLLALEWNTVQLYLNEGDSFVKKDITDDKGFWNFVFPHDIDQDGDIDIVAGNLGLNNKFKNTSKKEPLEMYINDFDDNKQVEQIFTYYLDGKKIPFANYAELTKQLPMLKKKYLLSKDLAKENFENIFPKEKISESVKHEVTTCSNVYFENLGSLNFKMQPLPNRLQLSTLNAAAIINSSNKENVNLLLAGNFYENNIEMGRYDADFGNVLSFGKNKEMSVDEIEGLNINGQVRRIEPINIAGKQCYIIVKNDEAPQIIQVERLEN